MEGGERKGVPPTRGQQSQVGRSAANFGRASSAENQWQQHQPKSSTLSYPGEVRKVSLLQKTIVGATGGQSVNKKFRHSHDKPDRFSESKVEYFCNQNKKWTDQAKLSVNKTRWQHIRNTC